MAAHKLSPKLVEAKLVELHGNLAAIARCFDVRRQSLQGFIKRRPALQELLVEVRESVKDDIESALIAAALKGEAWACCFWLKTQAKDRGYIERTETAQVKTLDWNALCADASTAGRTEADVKLAELEELERRKYNAGSNGHVPG